MFKFFKKKEKQYKFGNNEIYFFKNLINQLPKEYFYLNEQINEDFILGFTKDNQADPTTYSLILNSNLEKKYINKRLPHFLIIKNIKIWNILDNKFSIIELDVFSGLFGGFKSEIIDFSSFDVSNINIESISEKVFKNKDLDKLLLNFDEKEKNILSKYLDTTYEIILPAGIFYFIDNVGNGDVIALDKTGGVYLLTHDPAKETLIFSKEELLEKLQNKTLIEESAKIYESF